MKRGQQTSSSRLNFKQSLLKWRESDKNFSTKIFHFSKISRNYRFRLILHFNNISLLKNLSVSAQSKNASNWLRRAITISKNNCLFLLLKSKRSWLLMENWKVTQGTLVQARNKKERRTKRKKQMTRWNCLTQLSTSRNQTTAIS